MIEFLENIGDYFSQHFFDEDFPKKVFDKSGYGADHIKEFTSKMSPLSEKYYKFKNDYLNLRRTKDKVKRTHDFHTELLQALGYINGVRAYDEPVIMDDKKIIPVRYRFNKNDKPYLYIMEMQPMISIGDVDADGLYEQSYIKDDWEKVLPDSWDGYDIRPEVIKEALSELFLLPEEERPVYLIMLAGPKIFLIQYEKWKFDSYLLFDLEELFTVTKTASNRNLLALFYALLAKKQFISETESVLVGLEEDAHKASYGVTVTLKSAVIYAVEALANEAIHYKTSQAKTHEAKREIVTLLDNENFARELKDECLEMVYRLLFLFYAESRADLEILPIKDSTYQKGYSLEMLRDLEMVALTTDSSRNGYFFSESLWKLFDFLHTGSDLKDGFQMRPLDSPLFDNASLKQLKGIQFRNKILQEIVVRLSLSKGSKGKQPGRISYSNLGINQLGSVYESLLSYSGFFAREELIEVKNAKDKNGSDGTFLVPKTRRDDFKETEILKEIEHPEQDVIIPKGHFVYRLNGRDRKNSASYYTPEVLTQTTVKYTLKGILERLKATQAIVDGTFTGTPCADEILELKILEPAMGAAAFHNEVINQLAVAYLELKENEEQAAGRKRITPGVYKDELQKVKAYLAANNVYGVDLNPTAVELGKLSLWLNCMHKNMETPFFAHRLGAGNAVVGAWLKVYNDKDCLEEFPVLANGKIAKKPIPKPWWDKAPKRVSWNKSGTLSRKQNQIYHFLLPDDNMVPSYGIKLLKSELSDVEIDGFKDWRDNFKKPLTRVELNRLEKISNVIDYLLEEHYKQQMGMVKDTASVYQVYGQPNPQTTTKGYDEKERLTDSRKNRSAPYFKLKMILDYWCSLWFWDVRDVRLLPNRTEWYNEVESILQIDSNELLANGSSQDIKDQIRKKVKAGTLFDTSDRIENVEKLAIQHRFFHNEIEFIEVFKERGGFDVIVGNPPWIKVNFDIVSFYGDFDPIAVIRGYSSPKIQKILGAKINSNIKLKEDYYSDEIAFTGLKQFFNSKNNFVFSQGKSNLYKLVLENSLNLSNSGIGMVIDQGIFDSSDDILFREELYPKLKYLYRFNNELKLFAEVGNAKKYEVVIIDNLNTNPDFIAISNLFHPSTIEQVFNNQNTNEILGIKNDENSWELRGNQNRLIRVDNGLLKSINKVLEPQTKNYLYVKLPLLHDTATIRILEKVAVLGRKVCDVDKVFSTQMINETNGQKNNIIEKVGQYVKRSEFVISGPHFYVGTPFNKNPNEGCANHRDYSKIDLTSIEQDFLPRTVFKLNKPQKTHTDYFHIHRRRALNTNERTLIGAIMPPNYVHTNNCLSIIFNKQIDTLSFSFYSYSIIYDFLIRITGAGDIWFNVVENLPHFSKPNKYLLNRGLRLNCVTEDYKDLWNSNLDFLPENDCFSQKINNYDSNWSLSDWDINTSFKSDIERRQALIEIDVIAALNLGLSLIDLIQVYKVQFPVLYKNDNQQVYDLKGKAVKKDDIIKYICNNRIEDYKTAWVYFESIFKTEDAVV
jgi:hypothetical protein